MARAAVKTTGQKKQEHEPGRTNENKHTHDIEISNSKKSTQNTTGRAPKWNATQRLLTKTK